MKKIILYELLGMIKDNKTPKQIYAYGYYWEFDREVHDYVNDEDTTLIDEYLDNAIVNSLDDEIEIIEEEKEIKEIDMCTGGIMGFDGVENITGALKDKINELVREVNKIKKEGK